MDGSIIASTIRNNLAAVLPFLEDPKVTEILINGPNQIFIEMGGKLHLQSNIKFASDEALQAAITSIAQSVGRIVNTENPRLDARLPDGDFPGAGSRIAVVLPPCSRVGAIVSIRKFSSTRVTFAEYVKWGAITADAAQFLDICMYLGKNILVSGGTGSGKTTLLSLLCSRIPKGQRIIVIEDSSELQIHYEHVVRFETKQADAQGKGEVTMKDLLKSSLRLRPDRIVVGEVRSSEALELLNAMNTGHKGCMGTVHANSPEDAIVRLEALAQGGDSKISEKALRYQVASAIELIVQVSRYQDGSRRIAAISEVRGFDEDGGYVVVPIFQMSRLIRGADGKLVGQIESTGELPTFANEIADNKLPFPIAKFKKTAA